MCGIGGIVLFDGGPPDAAGMQRMVDALRHRGPDDEGFWVQAGVGMAHTRLSVIDLSPAGRQPMHVESPSLSIVYNGEVYNHRELRRTLEEKGHRFRSSSDTEVILRAYAEWGETCVTRLEGMFAFALWDAARRRLFAARDRLGIKPLQRRRCPARGSCGARPRRSGCRAPSRSRARPPGARSGGARCRPG